MASSSRFAETPDDVATIIAEFQPIIRRLAVGRYAISIGGSRGKGTSDTLSDVDFRLFCEDVKESEAEKIAFREAIQAGMRQWEAKGRRIDGCWVRKIADIDRELDKWLNGTIVPDAIVWTVWGYYLPTDINNQQVIEDPHGVLSAWKERLRNYPPALKSAVLEKHLAFIRYWRDDYHYANKVARRDLVFLAGLTSKLVHSLLQILFALNEVYYPGDGYNLDFVRKFSLVPAGFGEQVVRILYPSAASSDALDEQRRGIIELIDAVEQLVACQR